MWEESRWLASKAFLVILLAAGCGATIVVDVSNRMGIDATMNDRVNASSFGQPTRRRRVMAKPKPFFQRKVLMRGQDCAEHKAKQSSHNSQSHGRIPKVLVLTGRNESFDSLPMDTKNNIQRVLKEDPSMRMRWLGDKACAGYIKEHYDRELLGFFNSELHGSRRGDVCRTAVLLREGGFYLDLDVILKARLRDLVDNDTSFMSVYESPNHEDAGLLNAIMAAEPGSIVLNRTMEEIRKWYRGDVAQVGAYGEYHWMGPATLMRGLLSTMDTDCPCEDLASRKKGLYDPHVEKQWMCGSHSVRLYVQKSLQCREPRDAHECSLKRAKSKYQGVHYGLFEPGNHRILIGWTRPESCDREGCDLGGWDDALISSKTSEKGEDAEESKSLLRRARTWKNTLPW